MRDDLGTTPSPRRPADWTGSPPAADFLRAVIHTAAEGICVATRVAQGPFFRFSVWNDRMTEFTGYTMAEVNRADWYEALFPHPGCRDPAAARLERLLAGDELAMEEVTITRKDGTIRVLSISTRRLQPADGLTIVALITDVTDRRATEEALRRSEARLAEAQRVALLGSWEWDLRTGRVWWSDELYRRYGKAPERFQPTRDAYLALVHPDDRPRLIAELDAVQRSGSAIASEHRYTRATGEVGWLHMHALVERDAAGRAVRMWGTCQDVTGRKLQADARQALEDELREARRLESIEVLAAGVAHEFNNLLTTILGHGELAEADVPADSPARTHFGPIRDAGQRAAELCRQMLAYAGKARLSAGPVDLSDVARAAAGRVAAEAPVDLDLVGDLPAVRGDREQLRQMIGNLLANAAEAVADAGGRVRLTTRRERLDAAAVGRLRHTPGLPPDEYVVVEVRDTGTGMDEATLGRAFEPFFSTKFAGRGLGLPVVLGVVRGHGGGLDVRSRPGEGTTARVYLPAADR